MPSATVSTGCLTAAQESRPRCRRPLSVWGQSNESFPSWLLATRTRLATSAMKSSTSMAPYNRMHPLRRMQRFNCHATNTLGLNYLAGSNSSEVMKLVIEFIS